MTGLLIRVLFVGLVLMPSAEGADRVIPKFIGPRILLPPENFDECRAQAGRAMRDEMLVPMVIAADGTLKEFTLHDDSPAWMQGLAACALARLQFSPGTRDDVPMESKAYLTFALRAGSSSDSDVIEIDSMGPLVTSPRLYSIDRNECFPTHMSGGVGRFLMTLTVMPDGSIADMKPPVGSQPWVEKTAHCLLGKTTFIPGTANGVPVEAQATLPIVYKSQEGEVSAPELRSSGADIEAAYRACYPPDLVTFASAVYRFDISTKGRISNPRLVKGTGDRRLDEAGICILPRLEFTPFMQDGRAIRANVAWELPMRPPR